MLAYLVRRLLLIVPTLLGIMVINFAIVQAAPGGPIDVIIAQIRGTAVDPTQRFSAGQGEQGQSERRGTPGEPSKYRGAQGIDAALIKELEKTFGFDKPLHERFVLMMGRYITFDFGTSFFRDRRVVDLVLEKMPTSISLGLWSTIIIYLVAIPLGIRKALRDGSRFDVWTSGVIIGAYAIPSFVLAVLLIVLFAGSSFLQIFPLRGLTSDNFASLNWWQKALDYLWHVALPTISIVVGSFATLAMLTKNSFLDEINKLYVTTARAKGLTERRVLYGHVFRNAMLIVVSGFPGLLISVLFSSALLIEIIFSLDGLGLLGFEAALYRDYPVMFGTLYFFTLIALLFNIISDFTYTLIDPRIDFEARR